MRRQILILIALALAGCTSTPEATRERDLEAKRFMASPDAAVLYVYRSEPGPVEPATETNTVLYVDGRLIGTTVPQTFFRIEVQPGGHLLHGAGPDPGTLKLDTRPGELYFVSMHTNGEMSQFSLVNPEAGKQDILRCCSMLENWAPGQRPFLR